MHMQPKRRIRRQLLRRAIDDLIDKMFDRHTAFPCVGAKI
jgi:hypothetical protein